MTKTNLLSAYFLFMHCSSFCGFAQKTQSKIYDDGHGGKVEVPMGDISFADEIVSYVPGNPAPISSSSDPKSAIGIPDFNNLNSGFVSLGCGGELVIGFLNNVLVDNPGADLFLFEVGKYVEKTSLSISKNGKDWINVGTISGGQTTVDIAGVCQPFETFNYVKLVDLKESCSGSWPGADIDAIAAIGSGQSIAISNHLLFEFGKSTLLNEALPMLDSISGIIANFKKDVNVIIEGHTDSVGSAQFNKQLSESRANGVEKYLQIKNKIARFKTFGYGSQFPKNSNKTEQDREANRRVEIIILPGKI